MHPEIEKLIDLALADGQLTDKERSVILKKATELDVDIDEVEMVMDGKLHQLQSNQTQPSKEKAGNIKTCPSCGASVKPLDIVCPDCNHEFQNKIANKSLKEFIEKLEKEDNKNYEYDSDRTEKKVKIITQFPIPQTKEDILEFLSYCYPFLENPSSDSEEIKQKNAWRTKVGQAIIKGKMAAGDSMDKEVFLDFEKKIEALLKKEKKSTKYESVKEGIISIIILYFSAAALARWLGGYHWWPF
jgi:hypothetical protein